MLNYPLTIKAVPQSPSIVFQRSSNAGQPNIGNSWVTITLDNNKTSVNITIHPIYQDNYEDVLRVSTSQMLYAGLILDNVYAPYSA